MEGSKKPTFTRTYSETASTSSGFSFLNINKSGKGKEAKEEKEDDLMELQKMLEGVDEQEPIVPSKLLFPMCEVKGSPKHTPKRRELSHQTWKTFSETKENQPRSLSNTKGALLHSLSEQCELQTESSGDEGTNLFGSSPDIKRSKAEGSSEQESEKGRHKRSCLNMLKSLSTDETKSRTSVIDKLNDRVFSAVWLGAEEMIQWLGVCLSP